MVEAIYLCPSDTFCPWEGKAEEILQHFHKQHEDLLVTSNTFPIDVSDSTTQNRLLSLKNEVYLIQTSVSVPDARLLLKVRYLGAPEQALAFVYALSIRVGNYAFKSLPDEDCQIIYVKNGGIEVDLQMIKLACGTMTLRSVICVLNITSRDNFSDGESAKISETSDEDIPIKLAENDGVISLRKRKGLMRINSSERSSTRTTKFRNSFLQNFFYDDVSLTDSASVHSFYLGNNNIFNNPELECATCCTEMCPPIYVCMNGHSVCGACKNEKCRQCNQEVLDIRNTDLEDISMKKQHYCKYAQWGCGERGNCIDIRRHEVNCRFCVYKCCLCPQEGKFSEIRSHFKLLHSSVKIYETLRNKFPKNTNFAIISSEYGIFYCVSSQTNGNIEWNVTFCGPKERWFSCDLKIKGKKEELSYSFRRNVHIYTLTLSQADLKASGVKDKYAVLEISQ